jgi:undecaprenyl-diphosphatase
MAVAVLCIATLETMWISALLLIWVALVGYSRIYLGVHYPTDILTGWLMGAAIAFVFFRMLMKWVPLKTQNS